jgi:hypothetical protein
VPDISGSGEYVAFQSTATNFGASSGTSNAYVAEIARDSQGRLTGCDIVLASYGTGTGAGLACSNVSVGVTSESATEDGEVVRVRRPAVAYQSLATNLTSSADVGAYSDIFQAPTCDDVSTDTDSDGTPDCFDQCWEDPLKVTDADTDGDGVADCEDGCPANPQKQSAGQCGCDQVDNDTDNDGAMDCNDACPSDPNKLEEGECGCGFADTDSDSDGTPDCNEVNTVPTAIPSITPTPNFETITPQTARLSKKSSTSMQVRLYNTNLTLPVKKYYVKLWRRNSEGVYTVKKNYNKTSNLFRLSRLASGRYKVTYKAVSTTNRSTGYSAASSVLRLP